MLKQETIIVNGRELIKTYSDKNLYIKKVGTDEEYSEAIDQPNKNYQYEETDKKLEEMACQ